MGTYGGFSEEFWNQEIGDFSGWEIVNQRLKECNKVATLYVGFLKQVSSAMESFGKSLLRVTNACSLPDVEHGCLRNSLERLRKSVEVWGQDTVDAASSVNSQAMQVGSHVNEAKALRKKSEDGIRQRQNHIKDCLKKMQQANKNAKQRMKEQVNSELTHKTLLCKLDAKPKELDKASQNERKCKEAQIEAEVQFRESVEATNSATRTYIEAANQSFIDMQDIEEARIKVIRDSLWAITNICSLLAVHIDDQQEGVRLQVGTIDVSKEISSWVVQHRTLQTKPSVVIYEATPYALPSSEGSTTISTPASSTRSTLTRDTSGSETSSSCATPTPLYEARALYKFSARSTSEVSLSEGDLVTVMSDSNEEWILVRTRSGVQGFVPTAFVTSA